MPRVTASFRPSTLVVAIWSVMPGAPAFAQSENYVVTVDGQPRVLTVPRVLPDCRASAEGEEEIVICANPREQQRYRLPQQEWNPDGPVQSVSRERHSLYEQGDSGIGSCSAVGPGGWTGCALRAWKAAREQHGR